MSHRPLDRVRPIKKYFCDRSKNVGFCAGVRSLLMQNFLLHQNTMEFAPYDAKPPQGEGGREP